MRLKPRDDASATDATASARAEIRRLHRAPEPEVLKPLLRDAALDPESRRRVESRALAMLAELPGVRETRTYTVMEEVKSSTALAI